MVPYEVLVSHSHPLGHVHRQGLEDDQIDGRGVVGNLVPVVAFMVQLEDEGVGSLEGQPALLVEGHRPDLAVALLQMVQELTPQYRTVFNLYAIEGYSHQEIGQMLGISESTSKSNLSRARCILQEKVEALYGQRRHDVRLLNR